MRHLYRAIAIFILGLTMNRAASASKMESPGNRRAPDPIIFVFRQIKGGELMVQSPVLRNLADLNYDLPYNVARLESLMQAMPPAGAEARPLHERMAVAAERVAKDATARAVSIVKRFRDGDISNEEMRAVYEEAERIMLLQTPYLAGKVRDELGQAMPELLHRATAADIARRNAQVEEQANEWEQEVGDDASVEAAIDADGYDGWLRQPQRRPETKADIEEDFQQFRLTLFDPQKMLASRWAYDKIDKKYSALLKADAKNKDWRGFETRVRAAFAEMGKKMRREHDITSNGLGPYARAVIQSMRLQNSRYLRRVNAMIIRHGSSAGGVGPDSALKAAQGGYEAVLRDIARIETRLRKRDKVGRAAAVVSSRALEQSRELTGVQSLTHLAKVMDYFSRMTIKGAGDVDPYFMPEVRQGFREGAHGVMPIERVKQVGGEILEKNQDTLKRARIISSIGLGFTLLAAAASWFTHGYTSLVFSLLTLVAWLFMRKWSKISDMAESFNSTFSAIRQAPNGGSFEAWLFGKFTR